MLRAFFYTCSSLLSLYSVICLIRILLSWLPQIEYSAAGQLLARVCDPYLNWFRRFRFTRLGMVDFSPILALGILSLGSMTFTMVAASGRISVGIVLGGFVQVIWSFFSFILTIVTLFLVARLVYDLIARQNRYRASPFWAMLDQFLNPPITYVTRLFFRGRTISYRLSLTITLASMLVLRVGLEIGVKYLVAFLYTLPV